MSKEEFIKKVEEYVLLFKKDIKDDDYFQFDVRALHALLHSLKENRGVNE